MCDHANREDAMAVIDEQTWCDPCLEPLVRALNGGGIRTVASCCGHGRRPGSVLLANGRALLVLESIEEHDRLDGLWPGINDEPARARLTVDGTSSDSEDEARARRVAAFERITGHGWSEEYEGSREWDQALDEAGGSGS
jgi:hypothetical protein